MTRKQNPLLVTVMAVGMSLGGVFAGGWVPALLTNQSTGTTLVAAVETTPPSFTTSSDPVAFEQPEPSFPTAPPSTTTTGVGTTVGPGPSATLTTTTTPVTTTEPVVVLVQAEIIIAAAANSARISVGLDPVTPDPVLTAYARDWAQHMAETGELTHSDIDSLLDGWVIIGENIAVGTDATDIAADIVDSPSHLSVITGETYTEIGVGVVELDGELWVVQVFAGEDLPPVTTTTVTLPEVTTTIPEITTTTIEVTTTLPTLPDIPTETTLPDLDPSLP